MTLARPPHAKLELQQSEAEAAAGHLQPAPQAAATAPLISPVVLGPPLGEPNVALLALSPRVMSPGGSRRFLNSVALICISLLLARS